MKRQRFFLAAVATCAVLASYAVPCVCVAQDYGYSEAHGKEICDPVTPTRYLVLDDQTIVELKDGIDLSSQNLDRAKIRNVKLEDCKFVGCDFSFADLTQAVFVRCDFTRANFVKVHPDLSATLFVDCVFDNAHFGEGFDVANLTVEQLRSSRTFPDYPDAESSITRVQWAGRPHYKLYPRENASEPFKQTLIVGKYDVEPDFNISGAWLEGAALPLSADQLKTTRNFERKQYFGVAFKPRKKDERLIAGNFADFNFSNATFIDCVFCGSDLKNANFSGSKFKNVRFHGCELTAANFRDAKFEKVEFAFSSIRDVDFGDPIFSDASILYMTHIFSCLSDEPGPVQNTLSLDQFKSTWNWKAGRMDLIKLPPELQAQVDAALAKEAAQATEAEASPETAPDTQSETAPASETK